MFNSKLKKEIKELKEQIRLYKLDCKMAQRLLSAVEPPEDEQEREIHFAIIKKFKHDARLGNVPFGFKGGK